jgi:hypothetical protein
MIFEESTRAEATSVSLCNTERIPLILCPPNDLKPHFKKKGGEQLQSIGLSIYVRILQ